MTVDLKVLDHEVWRQLDLVSELFHRINKLIPETQKLLSMPPDRLVRDAVAEMLKFGYSQVPVMAGDRVL